MTPTIVKSKVNIRKLVRKYIKHGWTVIPVPDRKKAPNIKSWQKLRINQDDIVSYFKSQKQNIGVLLGPKQANNGVCSTITE